MPTVDQVVADAMLEVSMVPGLSTQSYGTPRLRKFVEDAFFFMFDENHNWNAFTDRVTVNIANGVLTADLVGALNIKIKEYRDVLAVWPDGSNRELREMSYSFNATTLSGGSLRYRAPSNAIPNRPFKVYPTDFTGVAHTLVRSRLVGPFDGSQELHLDKLALSKGAAYMYLAATGTNASHAASLQSQFVSRVNAVKTQENSGIIAKDDRMAPDTTGQWFEAR